MRTGIGLVALLIAGPTFAQDAEEAPPEEAPAEEASAEEAAPAEEAPAEEVAPAAPQVPIEVSLTNGLSLKGTASQMDLISWAPGQPLTFTPEGGVSTTLDGGKIASISQPGATPPAASQASAPEAPEVEYTSPGGFSHPNPAASRYLYAPSSIPMKKGQGYVSQKYGIFSSVAYAPHDNFTLLFGTLTFFPPAMTIFGGKAGFQVAEKVHISAGGEVFIFPIDQQLLAAIGFGAVSFGDEDQHLTVASGYISGEMFDNEASIPIMVGAQKRLGNGVALLTENWAVFDGDSLTGSQNSDGLQMFIGSAAVRLLGRRSGSFDGQRRTRTREGYPRTTWDIGLIVFGFRDTTSTYNPATDQDEVSEFANWNSFGPFPWVDWTWHFGPSGL